MKTSRGLKLAAALAALLPVCGRTAPAEPPARESVEWCDIWISHAGETNLPRVLLIGDSITRDYYPGVEKRLANRAFVGRLATSAFLSDPALLNEIDLVLSQYQFEVIHFNNGMHGWQHSEDEYDRAFNRFLRVIEKGAPNAKLIWASTTPLKASPDPAAVTVATDERVARRNVIALKHIAAEKIALDDLNASMRGHPEYHSDNVHFNTRGVEIQAAQVAAQIEAMLGK